MWFSHIFTTSPNASVKEPWFDMPPPPLLNNTSLLEDICDKWKEGCGIYNANKALECEDQKQHSQRKM